MRRFHRLFWMDSKGMGLDVVAGIGGIDRLEKLDDGLSLTYRKDDQAISLAGRSRAPLNRLAGKP